VRDRLLVDEHPDTIVAMADLAYTCRDQERWKNAQQLQLQSLVIRKRMALGEEHLDTIVAMANLASTYKDQA